MKGFTRFGKTLKCRECFYRKKSLAKQIQGSFISKSKEAYFFVIGGKQFYCRKECKDGQSF